ncbi:z1226 protein [Yersinia frederiksenii]|uniref:Z1226 protein n=1 Tax=Yersinia frederiksenii TaxID=29484 RepID=A0AAI8ZQX0_YERFR|nr:hypothetical protein B4902_21995 [Yersinia frederiksenii]CFR03285.1 z1226 protein [Yersinia frederiksenii]HEI6966724.1 DUF4942 domain-containing protein [Yersinia enterocolitica]
MFAAAAGSWRKLDVSERGIINVFKGLNWDYKSNSPCSFSKKTIVNTLVTYNRWGFGLNWGQRRDQLADLGQMLFLLDGKSILDNHGDMTVRLSDHINLHNTPATYEDDYLSIYKHFPYTKMN